MEIGISVISLVLVGKLSRFVASNVVLPLDRDIIIIMGVKMKPVLYVYVKSSLAYVKNPIYGMGKAI